MSQDNVLILINDPLSGRIFHKGKIIQELIKTGIKRVYLQYLYDGQRFLLAPCQKDGLVEVDFYQDSRPTFLSKMKSLLHKVLNDYFGFLPIAIRMNIIEGFNASIVRKGHPNGFYNLSRIGLLPNTLASYELMKWFYVNFILKLYDDHLKKFCREHEIRCIVLSNSQAPESHLYATAAASAGIPCIAYIASWDHPVGKGLILKGMSRYIVQNVQMKRDLVNYHGIELSMISVTGWPQMDPYFTPVKITDYNELLTKYGLRPGCPTVLFACNTRRNSPNEHMIIRDVLDHMSKKMSSDPWNAIVRPHPRDSDRFAFLAKRFSNVYVQLVSYTDVDILSLILKYVDCVVCSGGSILLDAIANDRPVVTINVDPYDDGKRTLLQNFSRFHYRRLEEYNAYLKSYSYPELVKNIFDQFAGKDRLTNNKLKLRRNYMGSLDGRSAERVARAVVSGM